ncbi:sensor histidine kinase, partial [Niabella aquatica]
FEWVMTNKRWNELYGAMVGKRLLTYNPAVIETGLFDDFKRVTETGVSITQEHYYKYEQFDGWFLQTVAKVEDGFLLSTIDITERKRHEAALALLAEISEELVVTTDINKTLYLLCEKICLHFNAAFCAISEVDESKGTVTRLQMWQPGDGVIPSDVYHIEAHHSDEVRRLMRSGRPEIVRDTKLFPKDVALRYASLHIGAYVNIPLVHNNEWRLTLTVSDNQPRDWKEDEIGLMRELSERIWTRVERVRAEEALRESEQRLKKLLKLRDEFISVASHELKTPVTSMGVYAEILQERLKEAGNKDDNELISRLTVQIRRLVTLINMLLDTTRIAEGELLLDYEIFDITELIKERVDEIKRTTDHRFDLNIKEPAMVTADKERIGQVITNLLSNAIKYSPKGSTIKVLAECHSHQVAITIQDEGCGISEADQERIFERFFRVTSYKKGASSGIGLGLYIVAQIVHRHGGTIRVHSKEGRGSAFTFTIPQKRS